MKTYLKPEIELLHIELSQMIATSNITFFDVPADDGTIYAPTHRLNIPDEDEDYDN